VRFHFEANGCVEFRPETKEYMKFHSEAGGCVEFQPETKGCVMFYSEQGVHEVSF
jgi:urease beta subunit